MTLLSNSYSRHLSPILKRENTKIFSPHSKKHIDTTRYTKIKHVGRNPTRVLNFGNSGVKEDYKIQSDNNSTIKSINNDNQTEYINKNEIVQNLESNYENNLTNYNKAQDICFAIANLKSNNPIIINYDTSTVGLKFIINDKTVSLDAQIIQNGQKINFDFNSIPKNLFENNEEKLVKLLSYILDSKKSPMKIISLFQNMMYESKEHSISDNHVYKAKFNIEKNIKNHEI